MECIKPNTTDPPYIPKGLLRPLTEGEQEVALARAKVVADALAGMTLIGLDPDVNIPVENPSEQERY